MTEPENLTAPSGRVLQPQHSTATWEQAERLNARLHELQTMVADLGSELHELVIRMGPADPATGSRRLGHRSVLQFALGLIAAIVAMSITIYLFSR